ncbi:MAG: glutathione transferase GstA, partial [Comamonadaceae bacterium]
THKLPDGGDYYAVNPLGYVPLLELDDGTRLREGPAIVQYIADQVPLKNLAPANGTLPRYRLQEWLTFIGTEIHKGFTPLFNPAMPEEGKKIYRDRLVQRLQWLDGELAGKSYLMGDTFTVADGYLYTVSRWAKPMQIDLSGFANLVAYQERVAARPAVQEALQAEGLK